MKPAVFTGSFFKAATYTDRRYLSRVHLDSLHLISVANSMPKEVRDFNIPTYAALVPNWQWVKAYRSVWGVANASTSDRQRALRIYESKYKHYLLTLDFDKVYDDLTANGAAILLCWEAAGFPCHRHWIADWFKHHGVGVYELHGAIRY